MSAKVIPFAGLQQAYEACRIGPNPPTSGAYRNARGMWEFSRDPETKIVTWWLNGELTEDRPDFP